MMKLTDKGNILARGEERKMYNIKVIKAIKRPWQFTEAGLFRKVKGICVHEASKQLTQDCSCTDGLSSLVIYWDLHIQKRLEESM